MLPYAWKVNGVGGEEQSIRGMQFHNRIILLSNNRGLSILVCRAVNIKIGFSEIRSSILTGLLIGQIYNNNVK